MDYPVIKVRLRSKFSLSLISSLSKVPALEICIS